MPNNATITHAQLRTLFLETELGGNTQHLNRFTYAEKGSSTYTFGLLQFDVGKNGAEVQGFLKENGFSDDDIKKLSQHGGLSHTELNALDVKLQAIPREKIGQFTNDQLDKSIASVGDVIDRVRKQSPAAADAISKDQKLQLGVADYENQFGPAGSQFVGFLAGNPEELIGGTVQAANPPTREDLQKFINATAYGNDKANAKAVESRAGRFDEAMGTLKLGSTSKATGHTPDKVSPVLKQGAHGIAVHDLQANLVQLGYRNGKDQLLKVDGDFGPDTRQAVEAFQRDHQLAVDGKAGPTTQAALHAAVQARVTPTLADPENPDHALYQQALAGIHKIDADMGRTSDQQSTNLAAALTAAAKGQGLARIDAVALNEDGSRAFAAQHAFPLMKLADVATAQAISTPLEISSLAAQAVLTPPLGHAVPLSTMPPPTTPQQIGPAL
jgi:peptidoglycan hydrolase-like protein with peptidoglycan-binding domain